MADYDVIDAAADEHVVIDDRASVHNIMILALSISHSRKDPFTFRFGSDVKI